MHFPEGAAESNSGRDFRDFLKRFVSDVSFLKRGPINRAVMDQDVFSVAGGSNINLGIVDSQ